MAVTVAKRDTTDYHAKYFAYLLSRRVNGDSPEKLTTSLMDSTVDLNPHQIDAALFAFHSPLSKGVILADEVGLGKTIEAGLVISQMWAERARRVLVITPSSLRKQWEAELVEKFHLPGIILESTTRNRALRENPDRNPFDQDGQRVVLCSIQFAAQHTDEIEAIPWDLIVIDEAHRLRNPSGKLAQRIKGALRGRKKLLLTATPLQNSMMELWGLTSLIDEHFFGERAAFRKRYSGVLEQHQFNELRGRLQPLVQRTLRKDAREFISYTERIPLREEFTPTPDETKLYEMVRGYLKRPSLHALPTGQRHLMTMMLFKLLASSTYAIGGALRTIARRLRSTLAELPVPELSDEFEDDIDSLQETVDEWDIEPDPADLDDPLDIDARTAIQHEIDELEEFADLADPITHNAKVTALKTGLRRAFQQMAEIGAERKALIFTESRRTQQYLYRVLSEEPEFAEGLMLFDGSNSDPMSRQIYNDWKAKQQGTGRITGSRAADIRAALVDYFRETGSIMIATEAASEGVNLQFCSLVINYDLPWNPQRIEQRIGRCHRYGQKHDVVVLNFLNKENPADQRVYELLDEKFHLFSGVFGASDEVLGTLESGVDIEKRIADIYRQARSDVEIELSFQQMQLDLNEKIDQQRKLTERKLFEHFDENVAERFRTRRGEVATSLGRSERNLMTITRHELAEHAEFTSERSFVLHGNPWNDPDIPLGRYELPLRDPNAPPVDGHLYRPGHPLGQRVIDSAIERQTPVAEVVFDYGAYRQHARLSPIEGFLDKGDWIRLDALKIEMDAGHEDHLLLSGICDDGTWLDREQIELFFRIPASILRYPLLDPATASALLSGIDHAKGETIETLEASIAAWINEEQAKLEAWSDDRRTNLVGDIDKLDREITKLKRELRLNPGNLRESQTKRQEITRIERQRDDLEDRNRQRRREIEREQDVLMDRAYARIHSQPTVSEVFTIRWSLQS